MDTFDIEPEEVEKHTFKYFVIKITRRVICIIIVHFYNSFHWNEMLPRMFGKS